MRRRLAAALCMLGCLCVLGGCGKEDAEVAVPQVEVVEEPQISQTEEQKEAELGLDTQAGTELGEEEITVMTDEGEPETVVYTRVRGIGDFSIAYDAEEFTLTHRRMNCALSLSFPARKVQTRVPERLEMPKFF